MRNKPALTTLSILLVSIPVTGCASAAPFSVQTPGLEALQEEQPYLYAAPGEAIRALGGTPLPGRISNLVETYEGELERAQRAQGGFLNATLAVLGVVLPISGMVWSIALSDPDARIARIVTGAVSTTAMAVRVLIRPQAKSGAAAVCESFLESALESIHLRWTPPQLKALAGTPEDWSTYLTMRGALEPARVSACGS